MPNKEQVLTALSTVMDPELNRDLVSLGMIENLTVEGADVSFTINLTTPACPLKHRIEADARRAVMGVEGVSTVKIEMASKVRASTPVNIDANQFGHVIAVGSGKGGVGKSTIAVALATSLVQEGARVGLLDADIYGPNIPRMLGLDRLPATPEGQKLKTAEINGLKVLSIGFFVTDGQPLIWRGPMLHSAIQQFLTDFDWGELDYLIVDMPPGTGDVQLSLSQVLPVSGAVVVSTPQQVALDDAARAIGMFQKLNVPILGVVENMAYLELPNGEKMYLFGEAGGEHLAFRTGVPLLGRIPMDPEVGKAGDFGTPYLLQDNPSTTARALKQMTCNVAAEISKQDYKKEKAK